MCNAAARAVSLNPSVNSLSISTALPSFLANVTDGAGSKPILVTMVSFLGNAAPGAVYMGCRTPGTSFWVTTDFAALRVQG